MQKRRKYKIIAIIAFIPVLALLVMFFLSGDNIEILKTVFSEDLTNDEIRDHLQEFGIRGYLTITILSTLQVILTVIPSEPIEVVSGLTFGFLRGMLACMVGILIGNTVIYILYKIFGEKLREYFDRELDVDILRVGNSGKVTAVILILYLLPAVTYGMIAFFAATMGMKYRRYIIVTTLGAVPSVTLGVALGHIALSTGWIVSLVILAVVMVLLVLMMRYKSFLIGKINSYISKHSEPYTSKTVVRSANSFITATASFIARILLFGKIKCKVKNNVGKINKPSVVLCNHGAFIDFVYAARLIRREKPNFIVNRMYFYKKSFGKLLRSVGCFPKSMFVTDTESAMNCIRVIKRGGVLAMMPEARLSTVGKFEDIQEGTYSFIKKLGVDVYTIKFSGDYLAKPKWASGIRRGSLVECELDTLFAADELKELSIEEIKLRTENALNYDELAWLDTHPEIRYKSKKMAEGLENILTRCEKCSARHSMRTEGARIYCDSCGHTLTVDSRYRFVGDTRFLNFAEWYAWQSEELEAEIKDNPDFELKSSVTLKHASINGEGFMRVSGEGECTLNRMGLTYIGTEDGENVSRYFPMKDIYRLLFGAGEDFEIYDGKELYYFVPEDRSCAVDWYIASGIFKKISI